MIYLQGGLYKMKKFVMPELEIITFSVEDIIRTSAIVLPDDGLI